MNAKTLFRKELTPADSWTEETISFDFNDVVEFAERYHKHRLGLLEKKTYNMKPKRPLTRVIREGVGSFCKKCGSTRSRRFFWFGKRSCDNKKCNG